MKRKSLRRGLIASSFSILVMTLLLVSTSLAWFNVIIENEGARIQAGNLNVEFFAADNEDFDLNLQDLTDTGEPVFAFPATAQPGDSITRYLKVRNAGSIDMAYEIMFNVVDAELGEAILVEVDKLSPVTSSDVFTGLTIDGEKLASEPGGLALNDEETYKVTLTFNESAGMEFQGKSYALDLLLIAWQAEFEQSRPILVSTLEELQAADPSRGQSIVLTDSIIAPAADVVFNELINLNLGDKTLTLNNLTIQSDDIGFMILENGNLWIMDTLTINTPNAEVTQAANLAIDANETDITTSGDSYLLFGFLKANVMRLKGSTRLVTEGNSTLLVTTLNVANTEIRVVVRPNALVSVDETEGDGSDDSFELDDDAIKGNRFVNDGESIQDAIDSLSEGGVILVAPGTYEEALVILFDDITLLSTDGAEVTIIDAEGATNGIEIGEYNKNGIHPTNVTIDGFTVVNWVERGIGQRNGEGVVFIYNNIVMGVEGSRNAIVISGGTGSEVIGNQVITATWGQPDLSGTGILLMGSRNAIVEDNFVKGADIGIAVGGYPVWESTDSAWVEATNNTVRNNTIEDSVKHGIGLIGEVKSTIVEENTLNNNNVGLYVAIETSQGVPDNNTIRDNLFSSSIVAHVKDLTATLDLHLVMISNTFDGLENVIFEDNKIVDSSKVNVINVEQNTGFMTIQGALDAANDGDTIQVGPGTYLETVVINTPNITLRSTNGREETIIKNPLYDDQKHLDSTSGLTRNEGIRVNNDLGTVTVEGFTVMHFPDGGVIQGRMSPNTVLHVVDNKVVPFIGADGFQYLRNGIQVAGNGSSVIGNLIEGAPLTEDWSSTAIMVINASNVIVEDNVITDTPGIGVSLTIDDASVASDGIPRGVQKNVLIEGNQFTNVDEAIRLSTPGYAIDSLGGPGTHTEITIRDNDVSTALYAVWTFRTTLGVLNLESNTFDTMIVGLYLGAWGGHPDDTIVNQDTVITLSSNEMSNIDWLVFDGPNHFTEAQLESIVISNDLGDVLVFTASASVVGSNAILSETFGKSLVLSAVNASEDGLDLNAVVIEFAEIIGLTKEIVDKFNGMPLDQGRHQAIGGAMWFTKEAESFNDLTEVNDLFTYLVSKEYNKFLWINAVRDASSASEMETAVRNLVPSLNETRQEIIASDPSNDLGLVGTNYTTTLFDINAMIEAENNSEITRIAEELFTQAQVETFFGVVRIADVLRAIIDEQPIPPKD